MAQIQKGTTYSTGDQVTATNLNALADAAILLPGAITDQTAKTVPLAADTVLIHSAADTALRKSTLTQLFSNATGIPLTTGVTGILPAANGGTGVANASTLTLAGNVTHAGAFTQSFTATANTALTLPTTGTLSTLAGAETLTNKTLTSPTLTAPVLGTPASGTVTNLTGTASININGTVGATTPSTGAFTTLTASGAINSTQDSYNTFGSAAGQGLIRIGSASPSGDNVGWLVFNTSNSVYNWRIAANTITSGALDISASTVAGGSTFTTSIAKFSSTGLAVTGQIDATSTFRAIAGGGGVSQLNFVGNTGNLNAQIQYDQVAANSGQLFFGTNNAGTFATRLTLTKEGNVGIGTTTGLLDAASRVTVSVNGTSSSALAFGVGGTRRGHIYVDASEMALAAGQSGQTQVMTFQTNGSERARIDTSGNLLVGTTSLSNRLSVVADSGQYVARLGVNGTGSQNFINFVIGENGTPTGVGSVTYNGSLTLFNQTSDYRIKNITGSLTESGTFIDALKPRVGTWKSDGSKFVGFVAHEFAEVCPSAVTGEKDAVDADGKPVYQAMQAGTAEVIANLVAELQSLRQRVAALESK